MDKWESSILERREYFVLKSPKSLIFRNEGSSRKVYELLEDVAHKKYMNFEIRRYFLGQRNEKQNGTCFHEVRAHHILEKLIKLLVQFDDLSMSRCINLTRIAWTLCLQLYCIGHLCSSETPCIRLEQICLLPRLLPSDPSSLAAMDDLPHCTCEKTQCLQR